MMQATLNLMSYSIHQLLSLFQMSNIYQKLYTTSRRDNLSSEEYAFVTFLDEPAVYSIIKTNRLIDVDSRNNGIIKDIKGSYRVEVVEKGEILIQ